MERYKTLTEPDLLDLLIQHTLDYTYRLKENIKADECEEIIFAVILERKARKKILKPDNILQK